MAAVCRKLIWRGALFSFLISGRTLAFNTSLTNPSLGLRFFHDDYTSTVNGSLSQIDKALPSAQRGRFQTVKDLVASIDDHHGNDPEGVSLDENGEVRPPVDEESYQENMRTRALAGDATAMVNLGVLYFHGLAGLRTDKMEALKWWGMAAEQTQNGEAAMKANFK